MARILTEGFELGDIYGLSSFYSKDVTTQAVSANDYGSGAYSLKLWGPAFGQFSFEGLSAFYYRFRVRLGDIGSDHTTVMEWRYNTTVIGSLRYNKDTQSMGIYRGTTLLATGSTIYVTTIHNNPYLFETYVNVHDTTGRISVKIEGVLEASIDFTGDTKPGSETTVNNIRHYGMDNKHNYYDDIALNDTTGAVNNSWCGDGRIIGLMPTANGDITQLIANGAGDNYAYVDERPPDGNTTYVSGSASGQKDLYGIANLTDTNVAISNVWVDARAVDTIADGGVCNLLLKTSGSVVTSGSSSLLTLYTKAQKSSYLNTNPVTGSAWTPGDIDDLQVGFEVV